MVAALVGLSVLMASILSVLPVAILFGVFLYMGISSIEGIQFFERLKLFFMPVKHHPQTAYVRKVSGLVKFLPHFNDLVFDFFQIMQDLVYFRRYPL